MFIITYQSFETATRDVRALFLTPLYNPSESATWSIVHLKALYLDWVPVLVDQSVASLTDTMSFINWNMKYIDLYSLSGYQFGPVCSFTYEGLGGGGRKFMEKYCYFLFLSVGRWNFTIIKIR